MAYQKRWLMFRYRLTSDAELTTMHSYIDTMAAHGYNGVVFDGHADRLEYPDGGSYLSRLATLQQLCADHGMEFIPMVYSIAWGDWLQSRPLGKYAVEGAIVNDAKFVAEAATPPTVATFAQNPAPSWSNSGFESDFSGWSHDQDATITTDYAHGGTKSVKCLGPDLARVYRTVTVKANTQYKLTFWVKTVSMADVSKLMIQVLCPNWEHLAGHRQYDEEIDSTQDWTERHFYFNSMQYTSVTIYIGNWESSGTCYLDDITLEESAPFNVVDRDSAPITVWNEAKTVQYTRGTDWQFSEPNYNPWTQDGHSPVTTLTIPGGSAITNGQVLKVCYTAAQMVKQNQVAACMGAPELMTEIDEELQEMAVHCPDVTTIALKLDEIRAGGHCPACNDKPLHEVVADFLDDFYDAVQTRLGAGTKVVIYDDMIDPHHNGGGTAGNFYYFNSGYMGDALDHVSDPTNFIIAIWSGTLSTTSLNHFDAYPGLKMIIFDYYGSITPHNSTNIPATYGKADVIGYCYTTWSNQYSAIADYGDTLLLPNGVGNTYYVDYTGGSDSNNGLTVGTAWKTISKVNSAALSPGDTVLFKRGEVWHERLIVPASGSSGSPITFADYSTGALPVIKGSTALGAWSVDSGFRYKTALTVDPAYVTFVESGPVYHYGVEKGSKEACTAEYDWYFDGSYLYCYSPDGNPGSVYSSVEPTAGRTSFIYGSAKNYITVKNIEGAYGSNSGFVFEDCDNVIVEDCSIHHCAGATDVSDAHGIKFQNGDNCKAHGNTVFWCGNHGIFIATWGGSGKTSTGCIAEYNTVYNCHHTGIDVQTCPEGGANAGGNLTNVIVRYNTVYWDTNWPTAGHVANGIYFYGGSSGTVSGVDVQYNKIYNLVQYGVQIDHYTSNIRLYNNLIYRRLPGSSYTVYGIWVDESNISGVTFKNNIVFDMPNACLGYKSAPATATIDYNLWYNSVNPSKYIMVGTTDYGVSDFSALKAATGWETHGKWESPVLTNPSDLDFTPTPSSPGTNAGVDVGLTLDFAGESISGLPDLGLYEYTGTPPPENQPPVAAVSATPTTGMAPLTVAFDGTGSSDLDGTIVSYAWVFGDGQTGSGPTINHTYQSAGTYVATLTVTDDDGATDVATVQIIVTAPPQLQYPVPSFTATPSAGDVPLIVTFDGSASYDPDGSIALYEWDFGDGYTGTGATAVHTYITPGAFAAKLTVTDNDGQTAYLTKTINVSTGEEPPTEGVIPVKFHTWVDGKVPDGLITAERLNKNFDELYKMFNPAYYGIDSCNFRVGSKIVGSDRDYLGPNKITGLYEFATAPIFPAGSLSETYLSANVPRKNAANTFSELQTLSAGANFGLKEALNMLCHKVSELPAWSESYVGRLVYCLSDNKYYGGVSSYGWKQMDYIGDYTGGAVRTYAGQGECDDNDPFRMVFKTEGATPTVKIWFRGYDFPKRHYTELPHHTHVFSASGHTHAVTDTGHTHAITMVAHTHAGTYALSNHSHQMTGGTAGEAGHTHPVGSLTLASAPKHDHAGVQTGSGYTDIDGDHTHGLSGSTGAGSSHSHSISVSLGNSTSNQTIPTTAPSGTAASATTGIVLAQASVSGSMGYAGVDIGVALTAIQKLYGKNLTVKIDGTAITSSVLVATGWAAIGDGSGTHALHSTGTGEMDASSWLSFTPGLHVLEISEPDNDYGLSLLVHIETS